MEPKASASEATVINEQDWEVRNDNGFVFMSPKRRRVDPSPDPPPQAPPSSSSADLQRGAALISEQNWDVLNDAGFVFMRPKAHRADPVPDPPPQAPPSSSSADPPEDPSSTPLQSQYQTEINQWVILSSTLRAFVGVACDKLERLRAESAAAGGSGSGSDELQGSKSDRKSLVALVHSMMPLLTEANSQVRSAPPVTPGTLPQPPARPLSSAGALDSAATPQSEDDTKPRRRVSRRQANREMMPVDLGRAKRSAKSPKYLEDFVPIEMKGKVVFFKNNVSETS